MYNHWTVSGQPTTVVLDVGREGGMPTEINTLGEEATVEVIEMFSQQGLGAKRFKIFVVPDPVHWTVSFLLHLEKLQYLVSSCVSKNR
jgi:hypothetical protein